MHEELLLLAIVSHDYEDVAMCAFMCVHVHVHACVDVLIRKSLTLKTQSLQLHYQYKKKFISFLLKFLYTWNWLFSYLLFLVLQSL